MQLRFTKNQTLILEIFFNHPERSYYFRQLGKIIGKEPGVFQRDINNLVESGYLLSQCQANSRFFKLNKSHPLYNEIKSIFFKTLGAEGKLRSELEQVENVQLAFIFGSFAKGKEDQYSDIDLMIIGDPSEDKLISKVSKVESLIGREINYNIFSASDFERGVAEGEVFLTEIIKKPKIFIIGNQNDLEKISRKGRSAKKAD